MAKFESSAQEIRVVGTVDYGIMLVRLFRPDLMSVNSIEPCPHAASWSTSFKQTN